MSYIKGYTLHAWTYQKRRKLVNALFLSPFSYCHGGAIVTLKITK